MRRVALFAVLLTALQIVLALVFAPASPGFQARYGRLLNWDSFHYVDIVENGYHVVPNPTSEDVHGGRANAVFFPAYPWLADLLGSVTGLPARPALLAVSQLACVAFWIYFLLLVRLAGLDERRSLAAAATVFVYPASFFLVMGYTESLFLAAMLGFAYWVVRWRGAGRGRATAFWGLAALHGVLMTATRVVGLGAVVFPIVLWASDRARKRGSGAFLLSLVSLSGMAAFLVYCQLKLGHWDMYFQLERIGWRNFAYPLALLDPRSYVPHFFFEDTVDSISRTAVPFMAALLIWAARFEWRAWRSGDASERRQVRVALYVVAFFLFEIAVTAKARANMDSMIRYVLPPFAIWVLCATESLDLSLKGGNGCCRGRAARFALAVGYALAFATQLWLMYRFLRGKWVA